MLAFISIVFCISWMPLNLFNVLADLGVSVFGNNTTLMTAGKARKDLKMAKNGIESQLGLAFS